MPKLAETLGLKLEFSLIESFIHSLRSCRKEKDLAHAKQLHSYFYGNALDIHGAFGNYIVPMFVECGSVTDAQVVVDKLVTRNVHSWTSLLSGYMENGQTQHASILYKKMQADNVHPSSYTLVVLLNACARLKDIETGREIHDEIFVKGLERNHFLDSALIDLYVKCGSIAEARDVFDQLPVKNIACWNALIAGYVEHVSGEEALKCFDQMQQGSISPNAVTFVCSLKACGSAKALNKGCEIHNLVAKMGLESDPFIGSSLVDMYSKCGLLAEAKEVFDKLAVRNIVSWTAILGGYVEHGHDLEALQCFEQMQMEGISPDAVAYVFCLKSCANMSAIVKGREMHIEVARRGFERNLYVGSTLIDMYARCGSFLEAQQVFDRLPTQNIVSWDVLLTGYIKNNYAHKALNCFEWMQQQDVLPDMTTYISISKACGNVGDIGKGREIHTDTIQRGFERHPFVASALIDMYVKCCSFAEAQEVFDKLADQGVVSWTTLIAGYNDHGCSRNALKCFAQMLLEGVFPDAATFVCIIKACTNIGALDLGREIHEIVTERGFDIENAFGNTLINMYAKCGSLSQAKEAFNKLITRDVVSWNALIAGHAGNGSGQNALKCFEHMQLEGVSPDAITFVCSLKACCQIAAIDKGQELHDAIVENGLEINAVIGNVLIDLYSKCGALEEAKEVFDKLAIRNVVSWNAMINAYGMNNGGRLAIHCFEQMQKQGIQPDAITFVSLVTACSRAGLMCRGHMYFKMMKEEYGIAPTGDHYTCMIDLFARSGKLHEAEHLVENAPWRISEEALTALLSACKTYGEVKIAFRCFQQLIYINARNAAWYVLMAHIYGNADMWDEANRIEEIRNCMQGL